MEASSAPSREKAKPLMVHYALGAVAKGFRSGTLHSCTSLLGACCQYSAIRREHRAVNISAGQQHDVLPGRKSQTSRPSPSSPGPRGARDSQQTAVWREDCPGPFRRRVQRKFGNLFAGATIPYPSHSVGADVRHQCAVRRGSDLVTLADS